MTADDEPFDGDLSLFLQAPAMFRCGSYTVKRKDEAPVYQCRVCQALLPAEPTTAYRFEIDLKRLDVPMFLMRPDAPAVACPRCGRPMILWSDEASAQVAGPSPALSRRCPRRANEPSKRPVLADFSR